MKIIKNFLFLLFLSPRLYSQLYVGISGEYSLPALKQQLGNNSVISPDHRAYNGVYSSYGSGFSPGIFTGYKLKPHFSVEFGYSYLFGANQTFLSSYFDSNNLSSSSSGEGTVRVTIHRIQPGVRFSVERNNFIFCNSLRLVIGAGGIALSRSEFKYIDTSAVNYESSAFISYGGMAIGFSDVFGVSYRFKSFEILANADFICQSWAPKKGKLIKDEYNGVDQLSSRPVSWKEYEYVNPGIESSAMTDKPSQRQKSYLPLSSIGFNLGVQYTFGK